MSTPQQRQAQHQQADTQAEPGKLTSLRDKKSPIKMMGLMGATAHPNNPATSPSNLHGLGLKVEGLETDAAEALYIAAITGKVETLQACLAAAPLPHGSPEPPTEDEVAAAAEAAAAAAKGGKGGAKGGKEEPEPEAAADGAEMRAAWRIVDRRGLEPLAVAAARGLAEVCGVLLDAHVDVNAATDNCGRTALHRAAENGHAGVIERLAGRGADMLAAARDGSSALVLAAAAGHDAAVEALLVAKASPDQPDLSGTTPLIAAVQEGHAAACDALLAGGADPHLTDCNGWGAMHHACAEGHAGLAHKLASRGVALDARTRGGRTLAELNRDLFSEVEEEVAKAQERDSVFVSQQDEGADEN